MKKLLSIVLCISMFFTLCSPAFAVGLKEESAQQDFGAMILLDQFKTENYEISAYQQGDMFYVITVLSDGRVEISFAEEGQPAKALWLNPQELPQMAGMVAEIAASDASFAKTVTEYAVQHENQSELVPVEVISVSTDPGVQPQGMDDIDDYNSLIDQLASIYGEPHTDYDWTNLTSQVVGGLTYNYKENLSYDMIYRNFVAFDVGASLGSIMSLILSKKIPTLSNSISVIANVLGIASAVNTLLTYAGVLTNYYSSVVYHRYVMINGRGPYFECDKITEYNGWARKNNSSIPKPN